MNFALAVGYDTWSRRVRVQPEQVEILPIYFHIVYQFLLSTLLFREFNLYSLFNTHHHLRLISTLHQATAFKNYPHLRMISNLDQATAFKTHQHLRMISTLYQATAFITHHHLRLISTLDQTTAFKTLLFQLLTSNTRRTLLTSSLFHPREAMTQLAIIIVSK